METINYMGSKRKLTDFIENSLNKYIEKYNIKDLNIFYDAFTGSGHISNHFKNKYKIITSDKQYFSKVINETNINNYIKNEIIEEYICKLNNLELEYFNKTDKFFTKKYSCDYNNGISIGTDGNPKIWIEKNAKKIDMIRTKIEEEGFIKKDKDYEIIKNVLLFSLIIAINKISNSIGHQNGYLKKWSKNSLKDLLLKNPNTYNNLKHKSINIVGDIFEILPEIKTDIVYFDPPYGTNNKKVSVSTRYSSFYHLYNTVILNERTEIFGKAGKPLYTKGYTQDLEKNKKEVILKRFKELIEKSNSKIIMFSYSNQGLLNEEDFKQIINETKCKDLEIYYKEHKINTQSSSALKEGKFIDREKENKLKEILYIFKKD
jgi:adenine-specific DNA-methyltransferase